MQFADLWHRFPPFPDYALTPEQLQLFDQLYGLVLLGNQQQNLTRITAPVDFWEKHLWDSLTATQPYVHQQDWRVIDIGTGAGFPGLPLAIAFPSWHITLLDSIRKKTAFVAQTITELGLPNAQVQTDRAEALTGDYDLAVMRAVGRVELCLHYSYRLLRPGGIALLYRGKSEAVTVPDPNLWQLVQLVHFSTPITKSDRHCLHFLKKGV